MIFLLLALTSALPASAAYADTETYSAVYEVPAPAELAPFARFNVSYTKMRDDSGAITLRYKLPATLVGQAASFTLSGRPDANAPEFHLSGANAEMDCVNGEKATRCRVQHHGVTIDLEGVSKALDAEGANPSEKAGRLQLASFVARAGGDLVGVLELKREN